MLKIPKIKGEISKEGRLIFNQHNKELLRRWLNNLREKQVDVVIRPFYRKRSLSYNAYYWGVVLDMISKHTGYTPQELHGLFKILFLKKIIVIGGKEWQSTESTAKLNNVRFGKYVEQVRQFALVKFDLSIPLPNEVDFEDEFIVDERIEDIKVEDIPFLR